MHLFQKGLGDTGEFAACHPLVNTLFFAAAIGITMFSMSPFFLAVGFLGSLLYCTLLQGIGSLGQNALLCGLVIPAMTLLNGLFTHDGETVLFYLNNNRITLEAFVFGACSGVMLVSVLLWFRCFSQLMTSDRLIYLFGKIAPVFGLIVSMIFRYIPLLRRRFGQIHTAQRCMGKTAVTSPLAKARQKTKEASILIAWSLEASIDSADSMAARGYGLKGRTSFHMFRFSAQDKLLLGLIAVLFLLLCVGVHGGNTGMVFYPSLVWRFGWMDALYLVCFAALLCIPFVVDFVGERKWKQYNATN